MSAKYIGKYVAFFMSDIYLYWLNKPQTTYTCEHNFFITDLDIICVVAWMLQLKCYLLFKWLKNCHMLKFT